MVETLNIRCPMCEYKMRYMGNSYQCMSCGFRMTEQQAYDRATNPYGDDLE